MGDISILEFGVYGFITYPSLLMLIISTVKEVPMERSGSIVRGIWLIPGILCAFILASSGVNIPINVVTTTNTITAVNTNDTWTEVINQANTLVLQNEVWVLVHSMIMMILLFYVILQVVTLFTKIK